MPVVVRLCLYAFTISVRSSMDSISLLVWLILLMVACVSRAASVRLNEVDHSLAAADRYAYITASMCMAWMWFFAIVNKYNIHALVNNLPRSMNQ